MTTIAMSKLRPSLSGWRKPRLPHIPKLLSRTPRPVGLERVSEPRTPTFLLLSAVVSVLLAVGLAMVLSASSVQSLQRYGNSWYVFQRQLTWVAVGVALMILASRFDHRKLRVFGPILTVGSFIGLLLVLIPGVGVRIYGSSRWLGYGPFSVQPSEFAKLGLLLFIANLGSRRMERADEFQAFAKPVLIVTAVFAMLVMMQPDMSTAMVIGLIAMILLYVGNAPTRVLAGVIGIGAFGAAALAIAAPYRRARMFSFLHPMDDLQGAGYQSLQSLIGLSDGRLLGVGVGASRAKWGFLPQAHTDFIFSVTGEEFGLIGSLGVLLLFAAIAVLGIRIALRAPDRFSMLLASGITAWILSEAVLNIGGAVGVLPVTGTPLPFMSSGGSSIVVMMIGLGILLNIARHERPTGARATTSGKSRGQGRSRKKIPAN